MTELISAHQMEYYLKRGRDHEKSIQQLLDDVEKMEIRLNGINEKSEENTRT